MQLTISLRMFNVFLCADSRPEQQWQPPNYQEIAVSLGFTA